MKCTQSAGSLQQDCLETQLESALSVHCCLSLYHCDRVAFPARFRMPEGYAHYIDAHNVCPSDAELSFLFAANDVMNSWGGSLYECEGSTVIQDPQD